MVLTEAEYVDTKRAKVLVSLAWKAGTLHGKGKTAEARLLLQQVNVKLWQMRCEGLDIEAMLRERNADT